MQDSTILNIIRWRAGWLGECLEGVCRAAGHHQAPHTACNPTRTSPVAAMMQCCPCLFWWWCGTEKSRMASASPRFSRFVSATKKTIMSHPAPSSFPVAARMHLVRPKMVVGGPVRPAGEIRPRGRGLWRWMAPLLVFSGPRLCYGRCGLGPWSAWNLGRDTPVHAGGTSWVKQLRHRIPMRIHPDFCF
jgi:hypothetical protein